MSTRTQDDLRPRPGEGERLLNQTGRRTKVIKGLLFGVGLACGAFIGFHYGRHGFNSAVPFPPSIAAGIAVLYLIAMLAGSVALSRVTDEVERFRMYQAVAFAGAAYLIVYPVWFLLWLGGFVAEPIHWLLFLGFWLSLAGAAAFYRFR